MDTCPKYNRAMVPSFTNNEEFEELLQWISDTATDPTSGTPYPDAYTQVIWIPFFRLVQVKIFRSNRISSVNIVSK